MDALGTLLEHADPVLRQGQPRRLRPGRRHARRRQRQRRPAFCDPHYSEYGYENGFSITAGRHHLNGHQALAYARVRKPAGESDFTRAARQQEVISAIRDAVVKGGFLNDPIGLLKSLGTAETNVPRKACPDLADAASKVGATDVPGRHRPPAGPRALRLARIDPGPRHPRHPRARGEALHGARDAAAGQVPGPGIVRPRLGLRCQHLPRGDAATDPEADAQGHTNAEAHGDAGTRPRRGPRRRPSAQTAPDREADANSGTNPGADPAPDAGANPGAVAAPERAVIEETSSRHSCNHRDMIRGVAPSSAGCEDCLKIGSWWVYLRMCRTCGKVGCCDSSPNRHASTHARTVGHPVVRSLEPGEDWVWCFVDEIILVPA